jgi:hypothetical protein
VVWHQSYLLLRLEFSDTSFNCFNLRNKQLAFFNSESFQIIRLSHSTEIAGYRQRLPLLAKMHVFPFHLSDWPASSSTLIHHSFRTLLTTQTNMLHGFHHFLRTDILYKLCEHMTAIPIYRSLWFD